MVYLILNNKQFLFFSLLLYLIIASCSIDHGINAILDVPTIRGKVIFQGEKPENTEWVVVVASRDFPPSDLIELSLSQSEILDLNSDTVAYKIILPNFGSYAAVGAVWKGKGEPLALSDVLGIYGVSVAKGLFFPDTVTVSPEHPVADSIEIIADYSRVDRGAVIRGRITYSGRWPDNTEIMGIAAFKQRPQNLIEFLNVSAINISLPFNVPHFDYKLAIPPGTYGYIVLLWKAKGTDFTDFEEIGFYETEPGSAIPGEVTVAKGDTVHGIDILIDFSKLDL
ncbi:MAG: hypothetical protein ACE5JB_08695 [bacterium]